MKSRFAIYLDYAATTPLDPAVLKAMQPYWINEFGNPSSIYEKGEHAKQAIEKARLQTAKVLNCRSSEIIFTAGGTESINAAIFGVARQRMLSSNSKETRARLNKNKIHIITSAIEHDAVLKSCQALERENVRVTYLSVDSEGFINPKDLASAIRPETVLVSVMYANNEIGTVEPLAEIASVLRKENSKRTDRSQEPIIFHTDACQAVGALPLNVNKLGVDLLTINASKIYGPKQVGLLYIRQGTKILPLIYGGGQENNLRSGTENTPGIVGFGAALEIAEKMRAKESVRLTALRDSFTKKLLQLIPKATLNGPKPNKFKASRLPNNINLTIPQAEGEALMLYLDFAGIIVSTGSACSSTSMDPSHVLRAIGRSDAEARSSIRMTMGRETTKKQLEQVLKVLPGLVVKLSSVKKLNA